MSGRLGSYAIALLLVGGCATPAHAQSDIELFRQFEQARARESTAADALGRAWTAAQTAQGAATAAGAAESETRRAEVAQLTDLERQISIAAERAIYAGRPSPMLATERALLEDWYDVLQRTPGNLTERSFLGLEVEMEGLAAAGLIEGTAKRFRSLREVRTALQAVIRRMGAQSNTPETVTAARSELGRLVAERDALLERLASENPGPASTAADWTRGALVLARESSALFEAQQGVFEAYERYARAARAQRPPALVAFTVRQPDGEVYRASWSDESGSTPDETSRRREREALLEERTNYTHEWDEIALERRSLVEGRLDSANRMATRSAALERSAQRYGELKERAFWTALAVDVGLTAAEIVLTGGTATLARKTAELAEEAATKAGGRVAAQELIAGAQPLERELIREIALRSDTQAETARRAARYVDHALKARARDIESQLVARGVPITTAAAQAERQILEASARLKEIDRLLRVGNQAGAERILRERALDELGTSLPHLTRPELAVLWNQIVEEAKAKGAGLVPEAASFAGERDFAGGSHEPPVDAIHASDMMTGTLIGESIELGFTVGANTFAATAAEGATGMAKYSQKFGKGMARNATNLGISVASSAIEIAAAKMMDDQINAEAQQFGKQMAELQAMYAIYLGHLQQDRELWDYANTVSGKIAGIDARLAGLETPFRAAPIQSRAGKAEGDLALELTFSSPLTAAPAVRVGRAGVAMRASGDGGRRWSGTVSAAALGPGVHPVEVAIDEQASPHGALDTDLTTVPIRRFGTREWAGFEAGADRAHSIRLDRAAETLAGIWRTRQGDQTYDWQLEETGADIRIFPTFAARTELNTTVGSRRGSIIDVSYPPGGAYECPRGAPTVDVADSAQIRIAEDGQSMTEWIRNFELDDDCRVVLLHWEPLTVYSRVRAPAGSQAGTSPVPSTSPASSAASPSSRPDSPSTVARADEGADIPECPYSFINGAPAECRCPDPGSGAVWGSDIYTSDSNICQAALHAGAISPAGGVIRVVGSRGRSSYRGSLRNGVLTYDWGAYGGSFSVTPVRARR